MSANRALSNNRLKMPTTTPVKATCKLDNYMSAEAPSRKDSTEFESRIPKLKNKQASFTTKKDSHIPIFTRSSTFNNKTKNKDLPVYREEPEIKARPFKRIVGFFVKKSEKELTVPVNPKLSTQKRKQRIKSGQDEVKLDNIDSLNIPVSLPSTRNQIPSQVGSASKSSRKGNMSENASTNASKTRTTSRSRKSPSKHPVVKKAVNLRKIETQNDNFLCSFISLRESEREKEKPSLSEIPFDESWVDQINNLTLETEVDDEECRSIARSLLPEFFENEPDLEPQNDLKKVLETSENSEHKQFQQQIIDQLDFLKLDKENIVCNVEKWRQEGVEAMINDIKDELGLSDSNQTEDFITKDEDEGADFDIEERTESPSKLNIE